MEQEHVTDRVTRIIRDQGFKDGVSSLLHWIKVLFVLWILAVCAGIFFVSIIMAVARIVAFIFGLDW